MSWDIFRVAGICRLVNDPENGKTSKGVSVSRFTVVVNGRKDDKPSFFFVESYGLVAESCNEHLKKGSRIGIDGSLYQDRWEDSNGNKKERVRIVAEKIQFL